MHAALVHSQTPPAQPAQSSSATPAAQLPAQSAAVLKTSANLVLVDVVVTNRGNAMHGLDKSHFRILEDGREQAISSFDEHRPAPLPSTPAKPLALPPNTWTNIPIYPPAMAVNVLLLDALNTPIANQMDVRRRMVDYMGKLPPGTPLAIFTLSTRLRLIEGFTTDPAQLVEALKNRKATPQASVLLDTQTSSDLDSITGDMATMGANSEAVSGMQQFMADIAAFQTDQRVRMTLDAMQQLARYLSAIPGRKNLIWFSGSFPIELAPDGTLEDPFEAMRSYAEQIEETSNLLSAARVAVYPVDARGLLTLPSADVSKTPTTNLMGATTNGGRGGSRQSAVANRPSPANDDMKFMQQTMAEEASMKQIAEATGGQEYINTNGFQEAVSRAIANGSSYYTIGYVPDPHKLDGRFHRIDVRLDIDGDKLAYRRGYFADSSDNPSARNPAKASLVTVATLHGAPPATQILFQARVLPATAPQFQAVKLPNDGPAGEMTASLKGQVFRSIVDLTIDPRGIAFEQSTQGVHQAQVEFVLVAYDAEGRRVNFIDRGFQINLRPGQFEQTMDTALPIRMALDLPKGQFSLRIAVHDLAAGRAGSLEVPVTVAAN
jgi:VWFA-related protein